MDTFAHPPPTPAILRCAVRHQPPRPQSLDGVARPCAAPAALRTNTGRVVKRKSTESWPMTFRGLKQGSEMLRVGACCVALLLPSTAGVAAAETGYELWLRYRPIADV